MPKVPKESLTKDFLEQGMKRSKSKVGEKVREFLSVKEENSEAYQQIVSDLKAVLSRPDSKFSLTIVELYPSWEIDDFKCLLEELGEEIPETQKREDVYPEFDSEWKADLGKKREASNQARSMYESRLLTLNRDLASILDNLADLDPEVRSKKKIEKYNNDLRVLKEKQESIESIFAEMGFIKRFVSKKGREGEKELKEIKDKIAELQSKIRLCDLSGINIEQDVNDPRRVYLQEQKYYIESDIAAVKENLEKIK